MFCSVPKSSKSSWKPFGNWVSSCIFFGSTVASKQLWPALGSYLVLRILMNLDHSLHSMKQAETSKDHLAPAALHLHPRYLRNSYFLKMMPPAQFASSFSLRLMIQSQTLILELHSDTTLRQRIRRESDVVKNKQIVSNYVIDIISNFKLDLVSLV